MMGKVKKGDAIKINRKYIKEYKKEKDLFLQRNSYII